MSVSDSAVTKLYLPYGMFKGGAKIVKDVTYHWFRVGRETPLAPYASMILNHGRLAAPERLRAEQITDELFSEDEYHLLRDYLRERHRESIQTAVLVAPLNSSLPDGATKAGGLRPFFQSVNLPREDQAQFAVCRLDEEEGYSLPFKVWGFAIMGHQRRIVSPGASSVGLPAPKLVTPQQQV